METEKKNPFEQDWEKEIANKSIEELAKILANKVDYAPGFVELVQQKLKSHIDYDEEMVNTIIAQEEEKKKHQEKGKGVSIWLLLFLCGVAISGIYTFFQTGIAVSQNWDSYNFPLLAYVISYAISMCSLCGYTFWAIVKKKPNAIGLANVYLWISIVINLIKILQDFNYNEMPSIRVLWGLIVGVLWLLYFKYSKYINEFFPVEKRALCKNDQLIIGTLLFVPISMFILSTIVPPSYSRDSVVDGIDLSDVDSTSYVIDENKLNENEITDGLYILKLPQGTKHEFIDVEDGGKVLVITDKKEKSSYEIRIISGLAATFRNTDFEEMWFQSKDSAMTNYPHELKTDEVIDINAGKCYRKIEKFQSEPQFFWDFSVVYNYKMHKYCVLSAWYNVKEEVPIDEIINSIQFEQ